MYSLNWPYVNGQPKSTARFKCSPEDFQVDEFFDSPFSGEGEHIVLRIEKTGVTTEVVVRSLAKLLNKPVKSIGYSGLKDRQAQATQWLSIHAPGEQIAGIAQLTASNWRVLEWTRHHRKLRPGFLTGNRFIIRLREISHAEDLLERIERIKEQGVPNYFGEQRFGRNANNLLKAEKMLVQGYRVKDRFLLGIYCSAARSWIYNLILSRRVMEQCWNTPLPGDVMQLKGSNSIFAIDQIDDKLLQRIKDKDISPASPLPGKSKNKTKDEALQLVNEIYLDWQPWLGGLEHYGLEEDWRANILHAEQLTCVIKDNLAELSFSLPAGSYATAILRELCLYQYG
ncbi:tRNA pseudouridine(13) synthase TruD [Legionella parisiensis]|uniref:tRNA pseudouridine synthase D n=1 Tax=Legionella parisiensis TaxID=45071 RepID=A0A1E5JQQ5_9GAMM|nr:tRNA pseudouridine(13) synthase TruD [Legionella parisiensis]KTD42012.1 hydrogenase [Legionella parisiensis]OEH46378.1 tRNA pseudouridine synthase D [Legionella parisiensis]STX75523.1 hydrogenase [Legionella parisiensis]